MIWLPLWVASIHFATALGKPCYLRSEALGARHGDLGLIDSCEGSG